jgi:uncharacterized membrane protein
MDIWKLIGEFLTRYVDVFLVLGIVLFVAGLRWALKGFRSVNLPDGIWRLSTLGLGVACAFTKLDYAHSFVEELVDILGKAFAYGGSATLLYQLYRAAAKKFLSGKDQATPAVPPQTIQGDER